LKQKKWPICLLIYSQYVILFEQLNWFVHYR